MTMEKLEAIEHEIRLLSPEDLVRFRAWFAAFDAAAWHAQIERDAASGRLDALAQAALAEHRGGHSRPL